MHRIQVLERSLRAVTDALDKQTATVQDIEEQLTAQTIYAGQNYIRNGNFDLDRNRYLYDTDWAGTDQADVSQEAAWFWTHPKDVAIDTTGTIANGSTKLLLDEAVAAPGDVGDDIIIELAGKPDILSTIASYTDAVTIDIAAPAGDDYTNARVRFRMMTRTMYATDTSPSTPNTTLKTSAHSKYASTIDNPDYDRTNGWARISESAATIDAPLQFNYLTPSKQYILSFIYRYKTGAGITNTVTIYAGFWDNTAGQQRLIEGAPLDLTATVVGTAGSTTREYFVVMYNGYGGTIGTETVTVTTSAATLTNANYVELSWDMPPGTVKTEIYRKTSGTCELLRYPYPANSYKDQGLTLKTVADYPAVDLTRPLAYFETNPDDFAQPIEGTWRAAQFNIPVPSTYDLSKTTDLQWLILGIKDDLVGSDTAHALEIDLICLDDKFGSFTRCPTDFTAKRQLSVSPTSGNQGNTGTGGNPPIPPYCVCFDAMIETDAGEIEAIALVDNQHKYRIINRAGKAVRYKARILPPQRVRKISAAGVTTTGSLTHPFFTSFEDRHGKPLKDLQMGDTILRKDGVFDVEYAITLADKKHVIMFTLLEGDEHGFWQDGFGVHNAKPELPD